MSTLSVPLTAGQEQFIKRMVKEGRSANKAAVVRLALQRFVEEEAVNAVLRSEQEAREGKILRGDLRKLAKKFR